MTPRSLLLAARQAYAVCPDGSVAASEGSDQIGWLTPPIGIVAGYNAVLIGTTADGVVLAFRGTLPPGDPGSIPDWVEDLDADPVRDAAYHGLVHAGFRDGLAALWPALLAALPAGRISITGHSMGGALAILAAARLALRLPTVVTFAAPRAGDATFVSSLDGLNITRFENGGDIVPTVPPLAYRPAGVPRLIWHGETIDAYPNGWAAAVLRSVVSCSLITAHTINAGGAYATAVGD